MDWIVEWRLRDWLVKDFEKTWLSDESTSKIEAMLMEVAGGEGVWNADDF